MKDDVKDALDKLVKKILAYNPKDKGKSKAKKHIQKTGKKTKG
jgi:hypothetical protein